MIMREQEREREKFEAQLTPTYSSENCLPNRQCAANGPSQCGWCLSLFDSAGTAMPNQKLGYMNRDKSEPLCWMLLVGNREAMMK